MKETYITVRIWKVVLWVENKGERKKRQRREDSSVRCHEAGARWWILR